VSTMSPASIAQAAPAPEAPAEQAGRRSRGRLGRGRDGVTAYLMIAPMVVLLGIFVVWPLCYSFYLSTFKISFYQPSEFVGLDFYKYVLTSNGFWKALGVGLYYTFLTVPAELVLSLLLATFIKTLSGKVAAFVKTTVYLPAVVSTVIAAVIFVFMYQDQGVTNWLIGFVSAGPVDWLNDPDTALPSIAVAGIWLRFGLTTLILLAGLLDIPQAYYEAAALDGAGYLRRTFSITIPLLKNVVLYLLVTECTLAIQMFDLPLVMTNGGPVDATVTPNLYIFNRFRDFTPYATSFSLAASLLLFIVLGLISLVIFRLVNSDKSVDG
jgi:multiple sugar transport system permease protein